MVSAPVRSGAGVAATLAHVILAPWDSERTNSCGCLVGADDSADGTAVRGRIGWRGLGRAVLAVFSGAGIVDRSAATTWSTR